MLSKRRGSFAPAVGSAGGVYAKVRNILPAIFMVQWKMGVSPILFRGKIHFHDYERKGSDYTC